MGPELPEPDKAILMRPVLKDFDVFLASILALYLSSTLVLVNLFKIEELTSSLLALPSLFAVLYNSGFLLSVLLSTKIRFLALDFLDFWSRLFIRIILGLLFIVVVVILGLLSGSADLGSIIILLLAIIPISLMLKVRLPELFEAIVRKRPQLVDFSLVAALSIVPLCILRVHSPFPLNADWDVFGYLRASLLLTQDAYLPTQVYYLPYLEIIFGLLTQWYGIGVLEFTWALSFVTYTVYGLGVYLLVFVITKSRFCAVAGAAFASLPVFSLAMALYRPIGQTFIYLSVPFALYLTFRTLQITEPDHLHLSKMSFLVILSALFACALMQVVTNFSAGQFVGLYLRTIVSVALITAFVFVLILFTRNDTSSMNVAPFLFVMVIYPVFHSAQGFSLAIFIFSLFLLLLVWQHSSKTVSRIVQVATFAIVVVLLLEISGTVTLLSNLRFVTGLEEFVYNFNAQTKYSILIDSFGWFPIAMLGIIIVQFTKAVRLRALTLLASLILLIYFVPLPGTYRCIIYLTPLLVVSFLALFAIIISSFSAIIVRSSSKRFSMGEAFSSKKRRYVLAVTLCAMYVFFSFNGPVANTLHAAAMTSGSDQFTFYASYELDAVAELRKNLTDPPYIFTDSFGFPIKSYRYLIISDPATQRLFSSLIKGYSLGDFAMSMVTMAALKEAFKEEDQFRAHQMFTYLANQSIVTLVRSDIAVGLNPVPKENLPMRKFVVITPRTLDWVNEYSDFAPTIYFWKNQFSAPPDEILPSAILGKFNDSTFYRLIYQSEYVLIVELKEPQKQTVSVEPKLGDWDPRNHGNGSIQARFLSGQSGIILTNSSLESWSIENFNVLISLEKCTILGCKV